MNKYDFMRDMLIRARNRHRKELGLCSEQPEAVGPTPLLCKPPSCPDEQAGGPAKPFDGTQDNPMPLGGRTDAE